MKVSSTLMNHITNNLFISKYLPPVKNTLENLNISITQNNPTTNPFQIPPELIHNKTYLDIYTDASLHKKDNKGSCSIYISILNYKHVFAPYYPASSTNLELQSILYALYMSINTPKITFYTDSLSSIQIINNFHTKNLSKQLQNPNFPIINQILKIITYRKSKQYTTSFNHVYSHLLDTRNSSQYKNKLK